MITIQITVNAEIGIVWHYYTLPEHIVNWNFASEEWHCPSAINDLHPDGELNWRMEAKDGCMAFDFTGTYTEVVENELIKYQMSDSRKVEIVFSTDGNQTTITQSFEPEGTNADEMQKAGWQAILNNFKMYVEGK